MPKGKVIEERPKKRRPSHKLDEPSSQLATNTRVLPKRGPDLITPSGDKSRFSKLKHRGHSDKIFANEFLFISNTQKRVAFAFLLSVLFSVLVGFAVHRVSIWYRGHLARSRSPLPTVISDVRDKESSALFWGSYRPGLYFGMKHRSAQSILVGLMWTLQDPMRPKYRHLCDSNDGVFSYNWLEHDGRTFGTQQIVDEEHIITVSFLKRSSREFGGDWTIRLSAVSRNRTGMRLPISFVVYFYYPDEQHRLTPVVADHTLASFSAYTPVLNDHIVRFHPSPNNIQQSFLSTSVLSEDAIMNGLLSGLGVRRSTNLITLTGVSSERNHASVNAWFYEVTVDPPVLKEPFNANQPGMTVLEVEFTHEGDSGPPLVGPVFSKYLTEASKLFHTRFMERFPIDKKKFSDRQVNLTKIALSNLLGGMGYFHGNSLIRSAYTGTEPVPNWDASLFTATPSRPMFPRGFLWDEGFHGLLLARWDPLLAMDTVGHWLDLMNANGWIPREQILGMEARSRVPAQFIVQEDTVANPPTLALVVEALIDSLPQMTASEASRFRVWSMAVLPRLHAWYQWFNQTQTGSGPWSYRWRGRDAQAVHQLNPLTLSSGLDDYPRASHPTPNERHLDLRCWMALFARTVARLASLVTHYVQTDKSMSGYLDKLDDARLLHADYSQWSEILSDPVGLDAQHWSEDFSRYADFGLHSDAVHLQQPEPNLKKQDPNEMLKPVRVTDKEPSYQLLTSSFGYLNLFPVLLRVLPPSSPRLSRLLADLADPNLTWTDHGLRSLSRTAPLYRKPNTDEDPPYWRNAIWINMNYLAVRSLRYYAAQTRTAPIEVTTEASRLAGQLVQNLARTVLGELERTGFLWEQYDDITGRGQRGHPFSGWTALISLILSENA